MKRDDDHNEDDDNLQEQQYQDSTIENSILDDNNSNNVEINNNNVESKEIESKEKEKDIEKVKVVEKVEVKEEEQQKEETTTKEETTNNINTTQDENNEVKSNNYNNNKKRSIEEDYDPDLDALTNLIIHNIPKHYTSDDLKLLFEQFGEIETHKVVANRKAGNNVNMGYGFVKYLSADSASAAIEKMNGHQIDSKSIKVTYATATSSQSTHANLYVNRLEPHVTKDDLIEAFSKFGEVSDAKILMDLNTNTSRCVGFVHFQSRREALSALSAMNGATIPCQTAPIYVKFADQKEDNKKSKQSNSSNSNKTTSNNNQQQSSQNSQQQQQQLNIYGSGGFLEDYNQAANFNMQNGMMFANNQLPFNPGFVNMQNMGYMGGMSYPSMPNVFRNTGNNGQVRYDPIGNRNTYMNHNQFNQTPFGYYYQNQMISPPSMPGYQPQPFSYPSQVYSVFISNLPSNVDEGYLYKLFCAYGGIANIQIIDNLQAIVNYLNFDGAQNAIVNLNGKVLNGKALKVYLQQ